MKYRYVVRKLEWNNTEDDWEQLLDYAKAHFSHVVIPTDEIVYFNATPEQLRLAVSTLRISTIGFDILTASTLEPSTHKE